MAAKPTKTCLLCDEQVDEKARRCRHCGAHLTRGAGGGPGIYYAEFSESSDLGLAGLGGFLGAIAGFLAGATLDAGHGFYVLIGAGVGFELGRRFGARTEPEPAEPSAE